MLETRDYMRRESYRGPMPVSMRLLIAIVVAFCLQQVNYVYLHWPLDALFALSVPGLSHGFIWQLITFQFLHVGLWHLFCNGLGIYFFGRVVEQALGPRRFLILYFTSGVAGGVLQMSLAALAPHYFGQYPVYGASAGVFGLVAAFALLQPDSEILLFFFFPVRAKYLLFFATGVALFFTLVPSNPHIAHAAHLGGIGAAVLYLTYGHRLPTVRFRRRGVGSRHHPRRKILKVPKVRASRREREQAAREADLPPAEFISREVDPILDKISAHGIHSLTPRERKILEEARTRMEKR